MSILAYNIFCQVTSVNFADSLHFADFNQICLNRKCNTLTQISVNTNTGQKSIKTTCTAKYFKADC